MGGPPDFKYYEPTGEYEMVDTTDFWCPTERNWSMCPGPCPDGTPHGPERVTAVRVQKMRYVGPGRAS